MPKEKFYFGTQVESDGQAPDVTVSWGHGEFTRLTPRSQPALHVLVNDLSVDRSGINRLIKVLRKARDQTYGEDA